MGAACGTSKATAIYPQPVSYDMGRKVSASEREMLMHGGDGYYRSKPSEGVRASLGKRQATPIPTLRKSLANGNGSWAMDSGDDQLLPSNTITPTRMSMAHEADGSVHPVSIRETKERHYSIAKPDSASATEQEDDSSRDESESEPELASSNDSEAHSEEEKSELRRQGWEMGVPQPAFNSTEAMKIMMSSENLSRMRAVALAKMRESVTRRQIQSESESELQQVYENEEQAMPVREEGSAPQPQLQEGQFEQKLRLMAELQYQAFGVEEDEVYTTKWSQPTHSTSLQGNHGVKERTMEEANSEMNPNHGNAAEAAESPKKKERLSAANYPSSLNPFKSTSSIKSKEGDAQVEKGSVLVEMQVLEQEACEQFGAEWGEGLPLVQTLPESSVLQSVEGNSPQRVVMSNGVMTFTSLDESSLNAKPGGTEQANGRDANKNVSYTGIGAATPSLQPINKQSLSRGLTPLQRRSLDSGESVRLHRGLTPINQPEASFSPVSVKAVESEEETLYTGVNPFTEAQVMKAARDAMPAHLKEPYNNCYHEAVPKHKLISLGTKRDVCLHTYYEQPLIALDNGEVLNIGRDIHLPSYERTLCSTCVPASTMMSDAGLAVNVAEAGDSSLNTELRGGTHSECSAGTQALLRREVNSTVNLDHKAVSAIGNLSAAESSPRASVRDSSPRLTPGRNTSTPLTPGRNASTTRTPSRNASTTLTPGRNASTTLAPARNASTTLGPSSSVGNTLTPGNRLPPLIRPSKSLNNN